MNRREVGKELGVAGVLAGGVVAFFAKAALLQGAFFVQDVMVQNYPFRHFFARALKDLTLPLWTPEINYGFPLFAEGQAGPLYFFNLLTAILLPTFAALNYNLIFHFWLAGMGTYGFLRLVGCIRIAALCGGLVYSCSGFLVVRAMSFNYLDVCAWMPVFFFLIELALRRNRCTYLLLAAGVVGGQFLAGHAQATVYSVGAGLLYGIYRGLEQRPGWRFWALLLAIPFIGAGLAAVQLVPTVELVALSGRSEGVDFRRFVSMSLPPERLITLLLPNFFGNSSTGSYWGREAGFYIQLCAYMGILPLLLSLVALRERRDGCSGFFGALCGLALILVLGRFTAVYEVLYNVPGLNFFRIPTRFLQWFAFGIAVLSGLGLDRVLRTGTGERHKGWWYLCGFTALIAGSMAWLNREVVLAEAAGLQEKWGGILVHYQQDLQFDLLRCVLVLGAGGVILAHRGGGGKKHRILALGAVLVVYGDLFSFGHRFNALIDPQVYQKIPHSAAFILEDAEVSNGVQPRLLSLVSEKNSPYDWHSGWVHEQRSYRQYPGTLRYYTGSLYGLANVLPGWSPLHLRRHWQFARGYPAFVSLAGIDYLVSYQPLNQTGLELGFDGDVKVYRNVQALPRAYLVGDYRLIPDAEKRLQYLQNPAFEPSRQVVLEEEPSILPDRKGGRGRAGVNIVSYSPEEVEIELEDHQGGFLVLSDTYYPGWQAWVDGREQRILRANHVFRAVAVAPGANQVIFRYRPLSFRLGAWGSAGGLVLWVFLLVWGRGQRCGEKTPSPVAGRRFKAWTLQGVAIVVIHALVTQWPIWAQGLQRSRALWVWGGG